MSLEKHNQILLSVFLGALTLLVLAGSLYLFRLYQFVGAGVEATNVISVQGTGEVKATPTKASFYFYLEYEGEDKAELEKKLAGKLKDILDFIYSKGVDEKDVKTTSFNFYPNYIWNPDKRKSEKQGYKISQRIEVKTDKDKAQEVLSALPKLGVERISGLNFEFEDDKDLKALARKRAIEDAKKKAKELARELGVDLVRVVGFSESSYFDKPYPMIRKEIMALDLAVADEVEPLPLPEGEKSIKSTVTIKYEIR